MGGEEPLVEARPVVITVEVGVGADATDPATSTTWTWYTATYNADKPAYGNPSLDPAPYNNDEYMGSFDAPAAGTYACTTRFSVDDGLGWTVCDRDGAGTNAGLSFDVAQLGSMTVSP